MERILHFLDEYFRRIPYPWWGLLLAYEAFLLGAWFMEGTLLDRIRRVHGDAAGGARRERRWKPVWFVYFVLLQLPLYKAGRWSGCLPRTWTTVQVGLLLTAAGLAIRLWSIHALSANFSYVVHVGEKQTLVTRGPYRLVRHPAYLGLLLYFTGLPVILCDSWALLLILAYVVPAVVRRIWREERWLAERFGAEFAAWKSRTKLLVPFLL